MLTKRKKKRKVSLKTLRRKAWQSCSIYIRKSYSDHRGYCICYTCGQSARYQEMDAGHGIPGRHNAVLFDTDIIRPQCKVCNVWKRGNLHVFTTKLIGEHGLEWMEDKLVKSRQTVKYLQTDYEQIKEEFDDKTMKLILDRNK